jgi:hypothetical protein
LRGRSLPSARTAEGREGEGGRGGEGRGGEGKGGKERGGEGDASARTHGRVRADAPCFTPGNFKKDATVRPSLGRPRNHRPIVCLSVCPSENVRMTTMLPGVRLPYSPTGYRGPPWSLRWATPSGHSDIEFFSSASLLTAFFIHFPESSSTNHKMHPLSRKLIAC